MSSPAGAPAFRGEAPGRVNLIGEHTDYNGGFVLPVAIPQRTRVVLRPRSDRMVSACSTAIPHGQTASYELGREARRGAWIDYVQGITDVLGRAGHALGGFDLEIESDVPIGSGLSSSAALEIAVLRALRAGFTLALDDVAMAGLARRAENEFVGAPVGIMDQMACTFADQHTALFLDTRTLEYRRVPLPSRTAIIVINSGVSHNHAAGDYRTRRSECEQAAQRLGVPELRDCGAPDLERIATLPDPLDRRARHVVTENMRVQETVAALLAGDVEQVGRLFNTSHASMRDDFEISVAEIDRLVGLAAAHDDVYGARLTGGGFGGSIVALAGAEGARRIAESVASAYARETGRAPAVLLP